MDYKRKQLQTKKEYYRRIAQIKKNKWINQHKTWEDTHIRTHFIFHQNREQTEYSNIKKSIVREPRTVQKLRNRIAAQQSRLKHQSYVKELEQKVKMYEEILQKQGALCKHCKKSLLSQNNMQCETMIAQEYSDHTSSLNLFSCIDSEGQILNSYLSDQIVRIDNKNATTPFGIFFIVCLVGVLAMFGLGSSTQDITPRLLASYQSTVNQLLRMQDNVFEHKYLHETSSEYIEIQTMEKNQDLQKFQEQNLLESFVPVSVDTNVKVSKNWTKHGDYICTQPSLIMKQQPTKSSRGPEFLLLKTGKDRTKTLKTLNITTDQKLGHRINIESAQWQEVQISSCFRQNL